MLRKTQALVQAKDQKASYKVTCIKHQSRRNSALLKHITNVTCIKHEYKSIDQECVAAWEKSVAGEGYTMRGEVG